MTALKPKVSPSLPLSGFCFDLRCIKGAIRVLAAEVEALGPCGEPATAPHDSLRDSDKRSRRKQLLTQPQRCRPFDEAAQLPRDKYANSHKIKDSAPPTTPMVARMVTHQALNISGYETLSASYTAARRVSTHPCPGCPSALLTVHLPEHTADATILQH